MANQKRIQYFKTTIDSFLTSDHLVKSLDQVISGVIATVDSITLVLVYPVCARTILRVRGGIS